MQFNLCRPPLRALARQHNKSLKHINMIRYPWNIQNKLQYILIKVKCTLVQALTLCTGRTTHRGSRGIALLRLCTGRTAHRGSRGIALLRLCTGCTAHRGSRGIALLRLCTGRTAHRGSRGIALLRLCTGRTVRKGSRCIALLFHDQRH